MNRRYNYQRENQECFSPCPCHCHRRCQHINPEINNKSEIISNIYTQNPNSDFFSSNNNNNNNTPLFVRKEILNYTYSPNLNNRNNFRKMRLRERAQSIKDKINSKYFLKNINKTNKNWNNSFNNSLKNNKKLQFSKSPLNQSMSYLKSKINCVNDENKYLTKLLSQVPRHEKSPYGSKSYFDKIKLSFTNGNFDKRFKGLNPSLYNKKYQGHSSMIMPPNDLDSVIIKSNTFV